MRYRLLVVAIILGALSVGCQPRERRSSANRPAPKPTAPVIAALTVREIGAERYVVGVGVVARLGGRLNIAFTLPEGAQIVAGPEGWQGDVVPGDAVEFGVTVSSPGGVDDLRLAAMLTLPSGVRSDFVARPVPFGGLQKTEAPARIEIRTDGEGTKVKDHVIEVK